MCPQMQSAEITPIDVIDVRSRWTTHKCRQYIMSAQLYMYESLMYYLKMPLMA